MNDIKICGTLNGACVHQDYESCDGCKLMEIWLEYKDKSLQMEIKQILKE